MSDSPPPPYGADPNQPQPNQPQPNPYQPGPYQPGQQVPYGMPQYLPGYGPIAPDHPQATTVLVLGILGIVVCGLLAPFAWVMGTRVVREIDASGGAIGGRSNANVGRILGIVVSVLMIATLALGILGVAIYFATGPA